MAECRRGCSARGGYDGHSLARQQYDSILVGYARRGERRVLRPDWLAVTSMGVVGECTVDLGVGDLIGLGLWQGRKRSGAVRLIRMWR
jgi:hypothetical protein